MTVLFLQHSPAGAAQTALLEALLWPLTTLCRISQFIIEIALSVRNWLVQRRDSGKQLLCLGEGELRVRLISGGYPMH